MSYEKLLRPIVQAARWPWYVWDKHSRPPSEWSHRTRRYIRVADPRTEPRVNILIGLFEKALDLPGDVAECGAFQGHTSVALGLIVKERGLAKRVYALDSFEGFDDVADTEAAYLGQGIENPLLRRGAFANTSLALVQRKIRAAGLDGIVIPIKGYFQDTLPALPGARYSFVHLDCDLGESYRQCLEHFYPKVVSGGYICFDEYRIPSWPVTTQVIDEFFRDKPEKPVELVGAVKGKTCSRWHVRKAT